MKNLFVGMIFGFLAVFSACSKDTVTGAGPVNNEERSLENFSKISSTGSTILPAKIIVRISGKLFDRLSTWNRRKRETNYYVNFRAFAGLEVYCFKENR